MLLPTYNTAVGHVPNTDFLAGTAVDLAEPGHLESLEGSTTETAVPGVFGAGFLYVRDGAECDRVPGAIGPRSVVEPTARDYEYRPGAGRFEAGATSPAVDAGLEAAIGLHRDSIRDSIAPVARSRWRPGSSRSHTASRTESRTIGS